MPTQCNAEQLEFSCVERRRVVAAFDGGTVSSDAGALLLQRTDQAIGLTIGWRSASLIVATGSASSTVRTLIANIDASAGAREEARASCSRSARTGRA